MTSACFQIALAIYQKVTPKNRPLLTRVAWNICKHMRKAEMLTWSGSVSFAPIAIFLFEVNTTMEQDYLQKLSQTACLLISHLNSSTTLRSLMCLSLRVNICNVFGLGIIHKMLGHAIAVALL
mmetsp:Transcript_66889/g.160146  ORF Transcript_66889/g.160146 Transcript_66889/m.160146 type:complete len:123 (-) Transcript_66889:863-1231(-)